MVIIGCTEEPAPIAVASVTLDSTSMTLEEGESQKLTATVSPSNAENKTVLWTSSNSSVASVKDGLVSAIKSGKATITAKSDDGGKTATCEVTVKAKVYPVESVSLDKTSYEMTEGDEFTLTATVKPDNATNKNVIWSSSNNSVASVSSGKVTALKAGAATITVKTEDGSKTATCEVNVKAKVYPVESVSLDKTSYEMTEGDEFTLTATVKPDNATNKNITWSSSNTSVASVSNGKVTALKAGTTTITVKTEDGSKTATCEVNVKANYVAIDYVDEYGVNHGPGVDIDGVVWAPVNCGYHATDYKYGKLYQWGRKYGQGYSGHLWDVNQSYFEPYTDYSVPTIEKGGVSVATGNDNSKENVFYTSTSEYNYDWVYPKDSKLWNSGTESDPVKTDYDPCPNGWRVPTYAELYELQHNRSSWTINAEGQVGCWFSGASAYTSDVPQVFLPAAGLRNYEVGYAYSRGCDGYYWSSSPDLFNKKSRDLHFYNTGNSTMSSTFRALGFSVRCVQD